VARVAGVTGVRRLLLSEGPAERRGVVLLDGQPERLFIERDGETDEVAAGAIFAGRVRRIERGLKLAFVDIGTAQDAILSLTGAASTATEGMAVDVEIAAPARSGKAPVVRWIGQGAPPPRMLTPAPGLTSRLQACAPGRPIEAGAAADEAAAMAEESVLATVHPLGAGASLSIEPTRGTTAIDVDVGTGGGGDSRRRAAKVNRLAIAVAARLLRLKGLGGLVVFDLAGQGQEGSELLQAARDAFAPDMPGVAFGPVSRLGVFHLALPWRHRPVAEQLVGSDGRPTPRTVAQRLARAIEREAARAVTVTAVCAPDVSLAAQLIAPALVARLGPRFQIMTDPAMAREDFEVKAQ